MGWAAGPHGAEHNAADRFGSARKRTTTMANIAANTEFARPAGFGFFSDLSKAFADWRLYRRTLAELQGMSDRDLADLGVSRLSIRDIAFDAVYRA